MKKNCLIVLFILLFTPVFCVNITIDTSKDKTAISPYIYGTNQDLAPDVRETARRIGGNRMTGYNWENNASNAGADWQHSSDNYMVDQLGAEVRDKDETGKVLTVFHEQSLTRNAYSLITLQLAGYVSKDKNGPVSLTEKAPSDRWAKVVFSKGKPFSLEPDKGDDLVYTDEELNFLINKYGQANTSTGIKGYELDNEPDIWAGTHPRIHPDKTGAEEYIQKSIDVSEVVKKLDPYAEVFGPASYGFNGYRTFQDAPDFIQAQWKYGWFLSYYLARMKEASDKDGRRLLDVLDLHWYPEAQGGGKRIVFTQGGGDDDTGKARMQAPRSLWDPSYTESSWICSSGYCPIMLIPKVKGMIDKYYPGTKLAFTEYNFGAGFDVTGGIAQADVLGIFGKYGVYMANIWVDQWGAYSLGAFRLYRNYDGKGGSYGDTNVKTLCPDKENMSVYASLDSKDPAVLHVILLNKDFSNTQTARVTIKSKIKYASASVWGFDRASEGKITERVEPAGIKGNVFSYDMPPLSAYHIVLKNNSGK